jgi:hypothetical protein
MILYEYEHEQDTMCGLPFHGPLYVIQMNKGGIVDYSMKQTDIW